MHTKQAESRKERRSERKTDRDRGDAISKSVLVRLSALTVAQTSSMRQADSSETSLMTCPTLLPSYTQPSASCIVQ